MKLNANIIDTWLKSIPATLKFVLIYGQDLGKGRIIADKIVKTVSASNEVNIIHFSFDDIKTSPSILHDEMASLSLLGDKKIIIIQDVGASISKEYQEILKSPKGDAIVIFLAEDLKPSSNIRKLMEASDTAISVPCYKDDPRALEQFIKDYLREKTVSFDQDVPRFLSEILPPNRLLIVGELDKLITYSLDQNKPIDIEEIAETIGDASELSLDDLCLALVMDNKDSMQKQITKITSEDANFVFILRVLLRYVNRILEVYTHMEKQKSAEQGVSSLLPPVFFKQKDNLIKVVKTVPQKNIKSLFKKLLKLELDCKNSKIPPQTLVCNFLTQGI